MVYGTNTIVAGMCHRVILCVVGSEQIADFTSIEENLKNHKENEIDTVPVVPLLKVTLTNSRSIKEQYS